ncbi:hypothetical protein A8M77_21700 [Variovorax sp. JS1663]|nr:hypothetical protein A8M77_21700 [Variovorax sp. JS1663]
MKAARIDRFGPIGHIALREIERPAPGPGEVLVRVHASGVGPWDAWIRTGQSTRVPAESLPVTLGSDLSGVVEAIGPGVVSVAVGDEVFGVTNPWFNGANAEFALAQASMIARKPARLGHVAAASMPVIAVTAWQVLAEYGGLEAGQRVLVLGAAGNVGAYAVQLARSLGATVVALTRPHESQRVRDLGAAEAIGPEDLEAESALADIVIDTVGEALQQRALAALRPGAILVSAVSPPDAALAAARHARAVFFIVEVTTERLTRIADMAERGELVPNVGIVLPLGEIHRAHEMLDGLRERPTGKIVLSG